MTERFHLSPKHRAVIEALLREHLPGVEVWAYGSRVDGRSHDGSDLDLVLRGPGLQEISVGQVADFEEAVRESSILFLVEARDWVGLPERFHREIERGYVVLVEGNRSTDGEVDWSERMLGELTDNYDSVRVPVKQAERRPGPYPYYGASGIVDHIDDYLFDGEYLLVAEDGENLRTRNTPIAFLATGKFWVNNHARIVRGNRLANTRYLMYALSNLNISGYLTGSTMPKLTQGNMNRIRILIPPLPEQRAIAHILGTLDDKIELNRRMNETLEAMARALYKSWFVDFDPVRAKAALRHHAAGSITPPLRGGRGGKGASPQSSRRGETGAAQPPRPWLNVRRQYTSKALHHAQAMRQSQTNAEGLLWYYLRNKQLGGYKFRRQQPIGPYIADFACLPEKLLIELDGGQHADPNAPDEQRDQFLRQQGYRVLRFWNHDVFADCFSVLERIYAALTHHPPLEGGSKDASLSGRGSPPPLQPAPDGLASTTPPQGGSDWSVDRARAYLDAMDPEIAALFPDRFVDSELGEIPAGWEVKDLGDLCHKPQYGYTASTQDEPDGPQFLRITDINKKAWIDWDSVPYCEIAEEDIEKYRLYKGDVLIARMADPGHGVMIEENREVVFASYLIRFRPIQEQYTRLLQYWLRSDGYWKMVSERGAGTTRASLNARVLSGFSIVVPSAPIADAFGGQTARLRARVVANVSESRALSAFRDALLPKLISGALRTPGENSWLMSST